ncbi:SDR family NAD(P)-dependent oxidoreductase [Nocardia cyriacigeorgica]|uniref:SDR family NAD(P)-dependent oxidoreductase n=1 Tax=Nocardia cyriacigeorgica TaxID=135487 RepID=UPI0013D844F1|nr:SDR family oxidoreductase [Nocardia cyriacigeorgica]NEW27069.1 SDR family oxidoreductase [Nocardia cyriacigeorgica]
MVWPHGESAFVTGGASGMGLGIVRALVAAGAKVAVVDRDGDRLADVVREINDRSGAGSAVAIQMDVGDPERWESAADEAEAAIGPISILVSNAGVSGGTALENLTLEVWRWILNVNLESQFFGIKTFVPRFRKRGGRAHVMMTNSMAGLAPMRDNGAYAASKWGGFGMALVLREELRDSDIDVSILFPGSVATRLSATAEEVQAKLLGREFDEKMVAANQARLAQFGADPDKVGEQVLEAMQNRQFGIITAREWEPLVTRVHDEVHQMFADFDGRHGVDQIPLMILEGQQVIDV